jgi:hypothetical protein
MWRNAMINTYRAFTEEEDELIMSQARGELTVKALRERLQTGNYALARRAEELGVRLNTKARLIPMHLPAMMQHDSLEPAKINDDKLLTRLHELFPERRYGTN